MRGSLPTVALLYACGISCATFTTIPLPWLFGVSFALASLAISYRPVRSICLWALIVFTGWTSLAARTAILSPRDLRTLVGQNIEYVALRGKLCETPVHRVFERDDRPSWRSMAQLQVSEICRQDQWQPAYGRVAISTPGLLDDHFFAGQTAEVAGVLRPPKGRAAEGLFDYQAYLTHQGIYYQLATEGTNDWRVIVEPPGARRALSASSEPPAVERADKAVRAPAETPLGRPWSDRFLAWAQNTLARGLGAEDEPLRLLWAMTLGWKTALTQEVSEPFMRTGTLHIFAISGLHIALIAGIIVSVLRVLQLPRPICGLVVIPLLWFYTAATGWQSSAIRSTIMMSIITAGWALRRPSDLINSLSAAALVILVWQPSQLLQAGFQLSFFVVLSIALFLRPLEQLQQRLLQPDPLLPPELRPRWQRWMDRPLRYLTASLATSFAAWLGSLPLIAYYFCLITPVSLLANLLIVPLSSFALMGSLGSLICGDWFPILTELFNHSAWFWMRIMISLSEWAAALPGAYFYVRPPGFLHFLVYYVVLGACFSGWLFAPQRRLWAGVGVCLAAAAWLIASKLRDTATRLTVLPLGGGALFVDAPGQTNDLLIDCGDLSGAEFVVRPFLRSQGVNHLPQLLLTHGDLHHVGGVDLLERSFSIARIITSSVRFRSPAYKKIIKGLESSPERWCQAKRGDSLSGWTILHPDSQDHFSHADDNAIVLHGEFHGLKILLLSDLGRSGQRKLMEREPQLRADIVIAGLPTQDEPLGADLIQAVQPRVLVVASAEFPAQARAGRRLRDRLARLAIPVIYTGDVGAVTLTARRRAWELRSMNGERLKK
jgi:competence protein ComEC